MVILLKDEAKKLIVRSAVESSDQPNYTLFHRESETTKLNGFFSYSCPFVFVP